MRNVIFVFSDVVIILIFREDVEISFVVVIVEVFIWFNFKLEIIVKFFKVFSRKV